MKTLLSFSLFALMMTNAAAAAPACVDLTAAWSGSCYNDHGPSTAKALEISQNGCGEISIDGRQLQIPSTYTVTGPRNETHTLQWDASGTTLLDTETFTQDLGAGDLIKGTVEHKMSLDGRTLQVTDVLKGVLSDWQGKTSPLEGTTNCSYNH